MSKTSDTSQFAGPLRLLANEYKGIETKFADEDEENRLLQQAVKSSFDFWIAIAAHTTNASPLPLIKGPSLGAATLESKHIRQVGKIGRYWDLCVFIAKAACRYPGLFNNLRLEVLQPFTRVRSSVTASGKSLRCSVHAEIQMVTFYGMTRSLNHHVPRVLGVSRSACYLCDLFVSLHGRFFISKTHGRLYDQWTVPDLAEFDPLQRQQYRKILEEMNRACRTCALIKSGVIRQCPPESTPNFHANAALSIAASTVTGNLSQVTVRGPSTSRQIQNPTVHPHKQTLDLPRETEIRSVHGACPRTSSKSQSPVAGVDPSAVDGLAKTQGLSPNGRTQVRAADSSNLTLNSLKERKSGSVNEAPEETSSDRQSPRVNCAQSIVDEPEAVRQPSPSTQTRNSTINPEALAPGSPRITESGSANKTPEETSSNRQSPRVYQSMIDEAEDVRQPSLNDKTQNTAVNPDGSAPYFPRETDSRFIHQPSEVMSPIPKSPRGGHDHSLGNGSEYEDLEHSPKRLLNASSDMAQISAPTFSSTTEISANALNLPLERTLSQQRPCSIQVQGFHVYFEADEPTQGRIAVKELPNDVNILASAIDVDALAPRDVVVLYRDNIKSILRLDLYRRGHQPIRIDLEWLPA
ncbi:MAG: hypothetical protein Q9179_001838 [Wetmoreana sp. 5 TL-2023]